MRCNISGTFLFSREIIQLHCILANKHQVYTTIISFLLLANSSFLFYSWLINSQHCTLHGWPPNWTLSEAFCWLGFQWHLVNFKGQFCHEPLLNPDSEKDTYKSIHGKTQTANKEFMCNTRTLCLRKSSLQHLYGWLNCHILQYKTCCNYCNYTDVP